MTYFPQPLSKRRAVRVRLAATALVVHFEGGSRITGQLQAISLTGGLLGLRKPLTVGALVEIMFLTPAGPVLGMAELLSPCLATVRCLQPFRFIALDDGDHRRLRMAIASSLDVTHDVGTDPSAQSWTK